MNNTFISLIVTGVILFFSQQAVAFEFKKSSFFKSNFSIFKEIKKLRKDVSHLQQAQTVDVDCSDDPSALQAAIDDAPAIGLEIFLSGTCNEVMITKDNITIDGQDLAVISQTTTTGFLASIVSFDASNLTLRNLTLDNAGSPFGLAVFAEKTDVSIDNVTTAGSGAVLFINGSNATILNEFNLDSILINALNSTIDTRPGSEVNATGYISATSASLFVNGAVSVAGFMTMSQGARADIDTGSLNLSGPLTMSSGSTLSISNSVFDNTIAIDSGATLSLNANNVVSTLAPLSVATNSVLYWTSADPVPLISCFNGGVAVTAATSTDSLCVPTE